MCRIILLASNGVGVQFFYSYSLVFFLLSRSCTSTAHTIQSNTEPQGNYAKHKPIRNITEVISIYSYPALFFEPRNSSLVNCVGLRNVPHNLGHLNTWFPVGAVVWGGLGGMAVLKKEPPGSGLESVKLSPLHRSLFFMFAVREVKAQLPVSATMPAACRYDCTPPSWSHDTEATSQIISPLYAAIGHGILSQQQKIIK